MVVGGGLEQFSVSPGPLGFGFGTQGFGAKGLGPGLDKSAQIIQLVKVEKAPCDAARDSR